MALTREQKTAQVADLKSKLEKSKSVIFAHYIGLNVSEVSDFRAKLKKKDAEMKVGKKTLLKIAMKELNLPEPSDEALQGAIACIFSYADPIAGAQITRVFGKDHEPVTLIGGLFEGKILSREEAQEFSMIPSRDILLATFAMMIRSPLIKFASACSSPLGGFARALSELAKKKESEAPVAATPKEDPASQASDSAPSSETAAAEAPQNNQSQS